MNNVTLHYYRHQILQTRKHSGNTILSIGGGLLGFSLALFILFSEVFYGDGIVFQEREADILPFKFFNYYPKFTIWFFLISVLAGFWLFFLFPIIDKIIDLYQEYAISIKRTLATVFIVGIPLYISWKLLDVTYYDHFQRIRELNYDFFPLYNHDKKLIILNIPGYLFMGVNLFGILLLSNGIAKLKLGGKKSVERYLDLRRNLYFFLYVLAFTLSLAILAFGALRVALLDYNAGMETLFPAEFVVAYGLFYTFVTAIFFIPINVQLSNIGRQLRTQRLPVIPKKPQAVKDWNLLSETVNSELKLTYGWREIVNIAGPILAPLLGAILPRILGS